MERAISNDKFVNLCHAVFGDQHGWKTRAAEELGCSNSLISQMTRMKDGKWGTPVSRSISRKIQDLALKFVEEGSQEEAVEAAIEAAMPVDKVVSDEEILERIRVRFEVIKESAREAIEGNIPPLIISGPPGVGKSYTVRQQLRYSRKEGEYEIITGAIRAVKLYELLYNYSTPDCTILFDDCDSIFDDEEALNLLKGALDTTESRILSWRSQNANFIANSIPQSFEFNGNIIFISNKDFDTIIDKNTNLAKHINAMINRCMYVNLDLGSLRAVCLRIKQVSEETNMLTKFGLSPDDVSEVISFIMDNREKIRPSRLSLRTAITVARLYSSNLTSWQEAAKISLFKREHRMH